MQREATFGIVIALALGFAQTSAAYQPGALLIVEPGTGILQWMPGAPTSSLVISGPPLGDPRAVAIDIAGNAIVADRSAGTFRYSPTGAFMGNIGIGGIDVAVGPNGGIYVLTDGGQVYRVEPTILLASGIADPRGIAVGRDAAGNELVLVTSGASNGQLLRVGPSGPPVVLASGFTPNVGQPGIDRFGNLLVPRDVFLSVLDPETGTSRGMLASSLVIDPQDFVATSGDRYFVGDGDAGGNCRIVEIDPLSGASTLIGVAPVCGSSPWGIAAVPGGTPAPKLATNDLVLTDPSAFGGGGAVLRIDPVTGSARPLLLGAKSSGNAIAPVSLGIGPTREVAFTTLVGASEDRILRLDPKTGRTTLLYTGTRGIAGPAYDHRGNLYVADPIVSRVVRTTGVLEVLFQPLDGDVFALLVVHLPPESFPYQIGDTIVGTFARSGGSVLVRENYLASESGFDFWFWFTYPIWSPVTPPSLNIRTFGGWAISNASPPGLYFPFEPAFLPIPDAVSPRGVAARRNAFGYPDAHFVADANAYGGGGAVFKEQAGVVTRLTTATFADPLAIEVVPPASCSDGIDNDDDGQIDVAADSGCTSADDPWETADCNDGIDNDMDGLVDYDPEADGDPGCSSLNFGVEDAQCSNGADDDGDGRVDGADPNCTGASDNKESASSCGLLGIEVMLVAAWAVRRTRRRH